MGFTLEGMRTMKLTPVQAMIGGFIGALIMGYVLSHFITLGMAYYPDVSALKAGIHSGLWVWLGFVAPVTAGVFLWEGKPLKLWVLNAGYYLVALIVMGSILALWS